MKALESAAWFNDEFGILKKGPKLMLAIPQEEQFNLGGSSSIKTIHDQHQQQPTSILKKTTNVTQPDAEVNLTKDDSNSNSGDSASQTSASSDEEEDLSSGDEGLRSNTSARDDEEMSATGSG